MKDWRRWRQQRPVKPGMYWTRDVRLGIELRIWLENGHHDFDVSPTAEWAGPIPTPKDEKGWA